MDSDEIENGFKKPGTGCAQRSDEFRIDEDVDAGVAAPEIGEISRCFKNDLGLQATAIVVLLDVSGASAVPSCSDTNMRVSVI